MTFSKVVISTSVKIWSISGISRAPLEAKEKKDQRGTGSWQREESWSLSDHTRKRGRKYSLEEDARVVEEIIQS